MKTADLILSILADGSATTDAIAQKLSQPPRVAAGFCEDLELLGHIDRRPVTPALVSWHLTAAGREAASVLTTAH